MILLVTCRVIFLEAHFKGNLYEYIKEFLDLVYFTLSIIFLYLELIFYLSRIRLMIVIKFVLSERFESKYRQDFKFFQTNIHGIYIRR